MPNNYLYGLTVQGIQSYIFATNKLKEIIGASEIIEQLCTTWFEDFIGGKNSTKKKLEGERLLNAAGNIRFKTDEVTAKIIFEEYHLKLLKQAPGVPLSQAVVEIDGNEYQAIQDLDQLLRGQRNAPMNSADLGIMTRQKYRPTGDFAAKANQKVKDKTKEVDTITSEKYNNSEGKKLVEKIEIENIVYPTEFSELAKDSQHSWLALIHIDGNGMGVMIKQILEGSGKKFKKLSEFSIAIAKCTKTALTEAINKVVVPEGEKKKNNDGTTYTILPIRPIIIGGDDVTVIIRADLALEFTKVYLDVFEDETHKEKLNNKEGVTACAGIAYIKEKFPFHYSANLAEELCVYAKNKSNREKSCLHFHRVQDSIIDDYKEIIARELTTPNKFEFINGPYFLNNKAPKSIKNLTNDIRILEADDSPKNGIREWIEAKFNTPNMADTLMTRLIEKPGMNKYIEILDNKKAFMDYHTLLAINTKTD
jgi:hypothetical protein